MAKSNLIETRTQSFGEMFSNGRLYEIPRFQRDYSWDEENWEELWDDVLDAIQNDESHYMGTVVLQAGKVSKAYTVIDGQQRFTTLSLLVLAAIQLLEDFAQAGKQPEENRNRAALLSERFVRSREAASLNYRSRLKLNQSSDGFYQSYIVQLKAPPAVARLPEPEKRLIKGLGFFKAKMSERFRDEQNGEKLAAFIETDLADRLLFIEVSVDDDLRAFTLFETLNARGVELTVTDLLKNFLFSLAADSSTDEQIVQERWRRIVNRVGLKDFPAMLRHFWNSANPYVREQYLFKTVRKVVRSKQDAFELLESLENISELHSALRNPVDPLWENDGQIGNWITELNMFRVTQCNPLIFAAWANLDRDGFKTVLRACSILSFRYSVISGLNTQPLERAYNDAAMSISVNQLKDTRAVLGRLRAVYVDDDRFESFFETYVAKSGRADLNRYVLNKIESAIAGSDAMDPNATIEHVLPENPSSDWAGFTDEDRETYTYRLGNLSLLEKTLNRALGNSNFRGKLAVYKTSKYKITSEIEDQDDWTPQSIVRRQRRFAKLAKSIWKIDF
jgi:uncharacterized protein with ParB-like and HNH nuclease domain